MKYCLDPTDGTHATNRNIIMWWEEYESFAIILEILKDDYGIEATAFDIFAVIYALKYPRATAGWIFGVFRKYNDDSLKRILIYGQE